MRIYVGFITRAILCIIQRESIIYIGELYEKIITCFNIVCSGFTA